MGETQDSTADLERRLQEREFPTTRQGEEARKGEAERVNADKQAHIAAMLEKHHNADELHRRIRELEGAVRLARLEIEDAIRERDELRVTAEGERGRAEGYRDALRDQAAQVAALRDALEEEKKLTDGIRAYSSPASFDERQCHLFIIGRQQRIASLLQWTAAAAQAHDARIRAEGRREGLRQAVAFLRAEADRREPHAEADALRVAADDLRVRAENLGVR